jgi:hypothetical protein
VSLVCVCGILPLPRGTRRAARDGMRATKTKPALFQFLVPAARSARSQHPSKKQAAAFKQLPRQPPAASARSQEPTRSVKKSTSNHPTYPTSKNLPRAGKRNSVGFNRRAAAPDGRASSHQHKAPTIPENANAMFLPHLAARAALVYSLLVIPMLSCCE